MIWATTGGIAFGLSILGAYAVALYKRAGGRRKIAKDPLYAAGVLLPFLAGWAYGALGILSVAGLVGWAFDSLVWVANWLGDAAGVLGVGAEAGVSRRGTYLPLTSDGSWFVLILTVVFLASVKKTSVGGDLKWGAWCGACLGAASGIAGAVAVPLAQGANVAGTYLFTWVGTIA